MNLLNVLSNKLSKLAGILMIAGLAVGCASVTDATFNEQPSEPTTVEQPAPTPDGFGAGNDVEPIYDEPW